MENNTLLTTEIQKYQKWIDNLEWHIKTNKPSEEEIKPLAHRINDYCEMIGILRKLQESDNVEKLKTLTAEEGAKLKDFIQILYCAVSSVDVYDDIDMPGKTIRGCSDIANKALEKIHSGEYADILKVYNPDVI